MRSSPPHPHRSNKPRRTVAIIGTGSYVAERPFWITMALMPPTNLAERHLRPARHQFHRPARPRSSAPSALNTYWEFFHNYSAEPPTAKIRFGKFRERPYERNKLHPKRSEPPATNYPPPAVKVLKFRGARRLWRGPCRRF